MTLPLIVILALLFGHPGTKSPSPNTSTAALAALTPSAPPPNAAAAAPCTALLEALPERLGDLLPRVVHPKPDSLFVVAWGNPAVILRCGVSRPADLKPGSSAQFVLIGGSNGVSGAYFDVVADHGANVFTTVDRAVYVSITMPATYASPPLPPLAQAIAKAMPAMCLGAPEPGQNDQSKLCTHRP